MAAVGAFEPEAAELTPALISASRVFVDTLEGAKEEAGDLIQAEQCRRFRVGKRDGAGSGAPLARTSRGNGRVQERGPRPVGPRRRKDGFRGPGLRRWAAGTSTN